MIHISTWIFYLISLPCQVLISVLALLEIFLTVKPKKVHGYDLLKMAIANNNFYLIEGLLDIGACPFQAASSYDTCFGQIVDKDKDPETALAIFKLFEDYGWFDNIYNVMYLCEK